MPAGEVSLLFSFQVLTFGDWKFELFPFGMRRLSITTGDETLGYFSEWPLYLSYFIKKDLTRKI